MTNERAGDEIARGGMTAGLPTDGMAVDSVSVAGWTTASRITGFVRVAVIAAVLGPTFFGNLFEATNLLPNLAFELLTGPLIAALLVPGLVRLLDRSKGDAARALANGFLGVLTLVFTTFITIAIVAGPLVLGLLTILVPDAQVRSDQVSTGWPLLAMLMPQALFYGIASIGAAVQNAHGRFALASAAPAIENIGIIIVLALSAALFGVGLEVEQVTTPHLLLLGLGTTGSVGLHAALQWWGARRAGMTLVPKAGWRNPEVRKILKLALPSAGFATLTAGRTIGLLIVAGIIPGGVIAFQLGRYFFNFPVAVGARPVMVAQLPRLSRAFNDQEEDQFRTIYRRGVDLILFVVVPASLLMMALAVPLARASTYGEMASERGVTLASIAIGTLALGVVGESLFLAATSAFYARHDARAPMWAMVWRIGLTAAGAVVAVVVGEGVAIIAILGLAVAISDLASGLGLHGALERRLPGSSTESWSSAAATTGIAAIAVALGAGFAWLSQALEVGGRFTEAALGATTVIISYLIMQRARRSPQLEELTGVFRRTSRA